MSSNPATAYVNHTSKINLHKDVLADLYENRIAAIHYGDFPSLDSSEWEEDYDDSTGSNAIGRLCEYIEEGRILTSSYTGHPDLDGGRFVGTVGSVDGHSDSKALLLICRNHRGNGHSRGIVDSIRVRPGASRADIEARADELGDDARTALERALKHDGDFPENEPSHRIIKGVEFNNDVEWIWNRNFPGLWATNKRQTIAGWVTGSTHLYAAYYAACVGAIDDMRDLENHVDVDDQPEVRYLSEGQLEILCSEYLRRTNQGYFETLPVGGSLSGVDIAAQTQDTEVLAQVTFNSNEGEVEDKLRRLLSYGVHEATEDTVEFHFFGPKEVKPEDCGWANSKTIENVYEPIERIFEKFDSGHPEVAATHEQEAPPEAVLNQLLDLELSPGTPEISG